ncbi:hypothetical protein SISSUDRAFT_997224 [Sistotremastrum suecicum HHB10207 ss-3]|uniref:BTB domain-containing protein n=1 Tax=Sistotremastrum suecicum HHB10207 ss-3 TaxID=1314776 RepID=A0A166IAL1_9AGAM|nr:hypothetical protein SISSUDRAFT_997224 [Sistotremastrum suecicum HHB10207 ss-3]
MASELAPPSLNDAAQRSTISWQRDLQSLFDHAKDRYPDVVWELVGESESDVTVDEVWGHKAIVYARAPPSFQARYFSFRPAPLASPLPYPSSPTGSIPTQSLPSLRGDGGSYSPTRSPSPYGTVRTQSPAPSSTNGQVLRLTTTIASTLFSNELEYLYTGKGFGEAFEFLFESERRPEGDAEEQRIDKLRKDLVFMWRSRLYSDVRISLTGTFVSSTIPEGEETTAIFSSHRFILVSRSPYFRAQLMGSFALPPSEPGQPLTLTLPSPPFTPASLHFTLGYIYTGTLIFSHRTYDLDTAFHIMRAAMFLSLTSLFNEIQARIIQESLHGLFHAFLNFDEYEKVTGGRWGVEGCRCRQCGRRAPRVLEFATADDVKNMYLERGARRALVGLCGEGWCNSEFASLPVKTRDAVIKGVGKRAIPINIFPLLFSIEKGLRLIAKGTKLSQESWADTSRDALLSARKLVDEALCHHAEECFEQQEWLSIMDADGVKFEQPEQIGQIMDSVLRGLRDKNAALVYQTLVSSILLRPHPTEAGHTLLPSHSVVRHAVDTARDNVRQWLRRHWVTVRQESGFNNLENWCLTEISHEIDVPVEDLLNHPLTVVNRTPETRANARLKAEKADADAETASVTSLRASVLNRNLAKANRNTVVTVSSIARDRVLSSGSSVRSVARSTASVSTTRESVKSPRTPVPQAKPSPTKTSIRSTTPSIQSENIRESRPKSVASSVTSVRSRAPTVRKDAQPIVRPPLPKETDSGTATPRASTVIRAGPSRPMSTASTKSDATSIFKTARSEVSTNTLSVPRSRRGSVSSNASNASVKKNTLGVPSEPRTRRISNSSTVSASSSSAVGAGAKRVVKPVSPVNPAPPLARPKSTASVHSHISTASKRTTASKPISPVVDRPPTVPEKGPSSASQVTSTPDRKGKGRALPVNNTAGRPISESDEGDSTIRGSPMSGLSRKESNETIKESAVNATMIANEPVEVIRSSSETMRVSLRRPTVPIPKGATLNVGIPCIISSKRARFRAFARYIGEVEGEQGPWVGVEVPVSETWGQEKLEGRQWNDGSWGGVRYFEISAGSEWDDGEERAARRRRIDNAVGHSKQKQALKREGEQLGVDRVKRMRSVSPATSDVSNSESRGLFVRPRQVLYVVDAVGSDL